MDEIADEHNVFQMLLMLNDLIAQSKKLTEAEYGASDHWDALQEAIAAGESAARSRPTGTCSRRMSGSRRSISP